MQQHTHTPPTLHPLQQKCLKVSEDLTKVYYGTRGKWHSTDDIEGISIGRLDSGFITYDKIAKVAATGKNNLKASRPRLVNIIYMELRLGTNVWREHPLFALSLSLSIYLSWEGAPLLWGATNITMHVVSMDEVVLFLSPALFSLSLCVILFPSNAFVFISSVTKKGRLSLIFALVQASFRCHEVFSLSLSLSLSLFLLCYVFICFA